MTQSIILLLIALSFTAVACVAAALVELMRGRRQSALHWVVLALLLIFSIFVTMLGPL